MSRIDASAWNTGVEPLEVELPGGETVRFMTLLDLPMQDASNLMEAGIAAGKLGTRVTPENLADMMKILRVMVDAGLTPDDRRKWYESRVPLIACMKLIPVLSQHYQASDGAFAAMQMTPPDMPARPASQPVFEYQQQAGVTQTPSASDLVANAPQYPWQQPEVMGPGEANGSPMSSPAFGVSYGETGLTAGSTSAFGQMTPNGTSNYSN